MTSYLFKLGKFSFTGTAFFAGQVAWVVSHETRDRADLCAVWFLLFLECGEILLLELRPVMNLLRPLNDSWINAQKLLTVINCLNLKYSRKKVTVLVSSTEVDCFLWKEIRAPEVRTPRLAAWASHDLRGSKVATAERDQPHDIPATFTGGTIHCSGLSLQ